MTPSHDVDAHQAQARVLGQMPILSELLGHLRDDGFHFGSNVLLFGTQHLMEQVLALCGSLNTLGLGYDHMFLAGKAYSTNLDTLMRLRQLGVQVPEPRRYRSDLSQAAEQVADLKSIASKMAARKATMTNPLVLVLDDGGHALAGVEAWLYQPFRLAGVEQTASGFWQTGMGAIGFPTVDVGSSAVKRYCEPQMIISEALRQAKKAIREIGSQDIGIVGLGYIGLALHQALVAVGHRPILYDVRSDAYPNVAAGQRARRTHEVFESCEVIFGCTGFDITRNLATDIRERGLSVRTRFLVSLSSGDEEFFALKSLLLEQGRSQSYAVDEIADIKGVLHGSTFVILRNGFPINFDNGGQSAPLGQIQGTIAALVAALCQTMALATGAEVFDRVTLDVAFQGWLYDQWKPYLPETPFGRKSLPRTSVERKSEPRFAARSDTLRSPFGPWTTIRNARASG